MNPMTREQRGDVLFYVPRETTAADPGTVARVAVGARALELTREPAHARIGRDTIAVLGRLLDTEKHAADLTRVLAELIALADHGDDLTAGDIRHLLAAVDINLDEQAADTYALRMADATAGAW